MEPPPPPVLDRLRTGLAGGGRTALRIVRITLPLYVAVDLLKRATPAVDFLGTLLSPAMAWFGMPGAAGFAFVAAGLLNIYAGIAVLVPVGLTAFQATQAGLMMGIAHNLFLEGGVLSAAGTRGGLLSLVRVAVAAGAGLLLNGLRVAGLLPGSGATTVAASAPLPAGLRPTLLEALPDALLGALKLSGKLTLIVVPLVAGFELLRHLPFFRRTGRALDPAMRGMGLSRDAAVPLFTGIFLGIAYGAGIIIRVAQEKRLQARELFLMGLFLATCHAVVEDTLVFVAIGGSFSQIFGIRLALAVLLTAALSRAWGAGEEPPAAGRSPCK